MKTIKIFLASSEELDDDRNAFGNLIRRLNKPYENRGIHLELFEWEDYDAAYNDRRKQDEYNDKVRASDMFLAVFHRVAGPFTIEEFDVATEEFRKKASPKVYTYCKDLKVNEIESEELKEFKKRLFNEMGHYWSRYGNRETMQLHFVMQLQLVENCDKDTLKVEDGNVVLDGLHIARMENLPFAGLNEDFQRMNKRLAELSALIEKKGLQVEKYAEDNDLKEELQALLNERNKLKKDFAEYQKNIFDTAKRIAQLQGERITDRMRRAMEAFNEGKIREANIILDEAERDGKIALQEYKHSKEITEQKRRNVISSIDEILLKTSTTMADLRLSIEHRIAKVEELYALADEMAAEVNLEAEKYKELLYNYASFLWYYAIYDKALGINLRLLQLCEELYGIEHTSTSTSYNNIGCVYLEKDDYDKAWEYFLKALEIREKVLGVEHPDTADSYNGIGCVYYKKGDYDKALEYHLKALEIREKVLGVEHPDTANSYNNIGSVYSEKGDYDKALEYLLKALEIREKVLGVEHSDTANSYNNIGYVYLDKGDYDKALEYDLKALEIGEKVLGVEHPDTATSYNNIGGVYLKKGDYDKALEYRLKALEIREKVLGVEHSDTANSYHSIGSVYWLYKKGDKALEYHLKALEIREKVLGVEHPDTVATQDNIDTIKRTRTFLTTVTSMFTISARCYYEKGDYDKALECYIKALEIREKVLGVEHPDTANSYNNIGSVYFKKGDYDKALEYLLKALEIREKVLGVEHPDTATSYNNIGCVYSEKNDYDKALECYIKELEIREKVLGVEHPDTANSYNNIGSVYFKKGDHDKALEYYLKALAINEKVFGVEHAYTANSYTNIGDCYFDKDNYDKALEYYLKELEIREKVSGVEHPDTATYDYIGLIYCAKNDYNKALEYFLKALAINEKVFGVEHAYTATSYHCIGSVYSEKGDYDKALEYHLKALEIRKKVLGIEHPDTQTSLNNVQQYTEALNNDSKKSFWSKVKKLFH